MNNLISPNTVSQNDEKPHTAELDDTAIPHVKIQITEIPHEKGPIPQYRKPPCPPLCEHPLKILNAKTIKFWYNERQLVSVPKGQCMYRLSKENKRDACPMDNRPNYTNKCLITSLSASS